MATIFLNLTNRQKRIKDCRVYTPESSKIELFEGEKVLVIKLFVSLGEFWMYVYFWKLSKREESFKELRNDIALNSHAW